MSDCALVSRRRVLQGAAGSAFVLALAPLFSACGDDEEAPAASGSTAKEGGKVRVGALGNATDTFNPFHLIGLADFIGAFAVYDSLALLVEGRVELSLAESITPNSDGSAWTIVLKEATFHDGRPVTSADVAYTLRSYANPEIAPVRSPRFSVIDVGGIETPDDRTVIIPLLEPRGDFLIATLSMVLVVPDGLTGGAGAIGSGPFKLEAYEAGKSIRLVRNETYWGGAPSLDELEIAVLADPVARLNALKGGELDLVLGLSPTAAVAEANNSSIRILRSGAANSIAHGFAANVTLPPFDNPDVVRALKLVVDRQALVDTVLLGLGEVGNDLVGKGLPGYNASLPQVQRDVAEAQRLFERAGVTELTMLTGEITPGTLAAADLLVQQLAEAGVTLTLDQVPADQYYADFSRLFTTPLQSCWWINQPAPVHVPRAAGSSAGFNLTGFLDPAFDAMLAEARATVDSAARDAKFEELQAYLHDRDGMVIWGFQEELNASVPGLEGVTITQSVPLFATATLAG